PRSTSHGAGRRDRMSARNGRRWGVMAVAAALVAAACGTSTGGGGGGGTRGSGTGAQSKFFVQADYDKQLAQRKVTPKGPADQPWLQSINATMADTAKYKKAGAFNLCFSNAGVDNPWR